MDNNRDGSRRDGARKRGGEEVEEKEFIERKEETNERMSEWKDDEVKNRSFFLAN